MALKVYIAGPYSLGNTAANVRTALQVSDVLMSQGVVPFCPHLAHFQHVVFPRVERDWLCWGLQWLSVCDAVLRIPGESKGADGEVKEAKTLGKPVFTTVDALLKWAKETK